MGETGVGCGWQRMGVSTNSACILGHLSLWTGEALRGFPTFVFSFFYFKLIFSELCPRNLQIKPSFQPI